MTDKKLQRGCIMTAPLQGYRQGASWTHESAVFYPNGERTVFDPHPDIYENLAQRLREHGQTADRVSAKMLALAASYSGVLTAIETFVVQQWSRETW